MNMLRFKKVMLVVLAGILAASAASCYNSEASPLATPGPGNNNSPADQSPAPTPTPRPVPSPGLPMDAFAAERDTTGYTWLNYRIFINTPEGWPFSDYLWLLEEVVYPVLTEYKPSINHFHFFRYAGEYADLDEEAVNSRLDFEPDQWAHMIKLRVLIEMEKETDFEQMLTQLSNESDSSIGLEVVSEKYDIANDLGTRFGDGRAWYIADMVESACILALAYAVDGEPVHPDPERPGGTTGAAHLVSNILFNPADVQTEELE